MDAKADAEPRGFVACVIVLILLYVHTTKMHTNACKCTQNCTQMHRNAHKIAHKCTQMHTNAHKCIDAGRWRALSADQTETGVSRLKNDAASVVRPSIISASPRLKRAISSCSASTSLDNWSFDPWFSLALAASLCSFVRTFVWVCGVWVCVCVYVCMCACVCYVVCACVCVC